MKQLAIKYTYDKPKFISSQKQDHTLNPKIWRRYYNNIIAFNILFLVVFGYAFSFLFNIFLKIYFEKSFSILKVIKLFVGHQDDENKILYAITLAIIFLILYFPMKKATYFFTKPINKIEISEGLYISRGKNVLKELQQAFNEIDKQ